MIIAHISDTHIALDSEDAGKRIADFRAVIEDINALTSQPDLIIHSGDIVHNGLAEEYQVCREILSIARAPTYALVGNKDNREEMRSAFQDKGYVRTDSDFIDYAITGYLVTVLALDTLLPGHNKGTFCEQRAANLERLIESAPEKPLAVFTHHPPFKVTVGPEPMHFDSDASIERLRDVLLKCGRVIALFSGHVHRMTTGHVGNIPANVMTAVATPLRWGEYSEETKSMPVYQLHRYDPESGFVTETRLVRMQA